MELLIILLCLVGLFIWIIVFKALLDTLFDSLRAHIEQRYGPKAKTWIWTLIALAVSVFWMTYLAPQHFDELRIWFRGGTTINAESRAAEGTIVSRSLRKPMTVLLGTIAGIGSTAFAVIGIVFLVRRKTFYEGGYVIPKAPAQKTSEPQYYLLVDEAQSGPFNITELRRLWHAGRIPQNAFYCFPGADNWQSIHLLSKMLSEMQ